MLKVLYLCEVGNNRYIKIRRFAGEKTPAKAENLLTLKEDQQVRKGALVS